MSAPTRDLGCCAICGDDYGEQALNEDGICEGCVNEADGLCRCGNDAGGKRECPECSYDRWADEKYHAMVDDGLIP